MKLNSKNILFYVIFLLEAALGPYSVLFVHRNVHVYLIYNLINIFGITKVSLEPTYYTFKMDGLTQCLQKTVLELT